MKNNIRFNGQLNVIGSVIQKYRNLQGLSLNDLSNRLILLGIDISKNCLYKIEHGRRIIKDYELAGLSKVLKVDPNDLLKEFIEKLD